MTTAKELREQAKSYGLRGYSTLQKPGLIRLIAEARAPVFCERAARARKTGRYPALTRGDTDNPHKNYHLLLPRSEATSCTVIILFEFVSHFWI